MNTPLPSSDQALAVFAHELREPLAAILYATHVMSTSPRGECDAHEMCGIVERQSQYVARLIDDVLDVCRGRSDKLILHKDWFDVKDVITQAVESSYPLLNQRRHHLIVSLPKERVCAMLDAFRIQQVVINLLANAAKYTNAGGTIRLAVGAANDSIIIEVRDNGVGIPQALLPRVFDLFQQGEEIPKGVSSGLGIGLALVKSLVELHSGNVMAYSNGIGTGARFIVRLPKAGVAVNEGPVHRTSMADFVLTAPQPVTDPMCDA